MKAVGKPCAGKLHARFDEGPLGRSPQTSGLLYEKFDRFLHILKKGELS